jgi:hypothetical protein
MKDNDNDNDNIVEHYETMSNSKILFITGGALAGLLGLIFFIVFIKYTYIFNKFLKNEENMNKFSIFIGATAFTSLALMVTSRFVKS